MRTPVLNSLLLVVIRGLDVWPDVCANFTPAASPKMTTKSTPEAVHRSAIVIDTHADTPQRFLDENFDLGDPLNGGNLNLESARKGNLGAEFFSIWVEPKLYKGQYAQRTLELIDAVKQQVAKHPDQMMFVATPEGIEAGAPRAQAGGADGHRGRPLDRGFAGAAAPVLRAGRALHDADVVELERLGRQLRRYRRHVGSAHQGRAERVRQGRGVRDEPAGHDGGHLARLGPDVFPHADHHARAGDRVALVGAGAVRCAAQHDRRHAARGGATPAGPDSKGGVVQVNFYSGFLSQAYRDAQKAQKPEVDKAVQELKDKAKAEGKEVTYEEISKVQRQFADRIPRPPLSVLIDHIDHIAKVAGVDHVGLGSDFDGVERAVAGGHRLGGRPAQDHRGADGARLLGRRLPQDPGRKSAAGVSRSGGGGEGTAGREPAADHGEAAVRQAAETVISGQ